MTPRIGGQNLILCLIKDRRVELTPQAPVHTLARVAPLPPEGESTVQSGDAALMDT